MREIVLDTETTGLDPLGGHRIVELGAVELVDHRRPSRRFIATCVRSALCRRTLSSARAYCRFLGGQACALRSSAVTRGGNGMGRTLTIA